MSRQQQLVFVAPYDDPYTIAGQGTIGTEILRQLTTLQLDTLHAIFVPVGGGGLVAGIAAYVKAVKPEVKIIGVEPSGTNLGQGRFCVCSCETCCGLLLFVASRGQNHCRGALRYLTSFSEIQANCCQR